MLVKGNGFLELSLYDISILSLLRIISELELTSCPSEREWARILKRVNNELKLNIFFIFLKPCTFWGGGSEVVKTNDRRRFYVPRL